MWCWQCGSVCSRGVCAGSPSFPLAEVLCLLQGDASKSDSEGELFLRSLEEEGGLKKNLSNPVCEYRTRDTCHASQPLLL